MEQNLRGPSNHGKVLGKEGTHFKGRRRAGMMASSILNSEAGAHHIPSQEGMTETIEMHDLSAREQKEEEKEQQQR
jgi:hypothetical protein